MYFLIYVFLICVGYFTNYSNATSASHEWDLLIFTQHWPLTVCLQWKEEKPEHTCSLPTKERWTIHGVWPTKLGTKGPAFCNSSLHFNVTALQSIENDLVFYWGDVHNSTSKQKLWKHEWQKHGSCAVTLPALDTELKYFSQGLQWIKTYGMDNILLKAGIKPNSNYTPETVWESVQKITGKNPAVQCLTDTKDKQSYLFEIRICFDKNLTLVDCDGIKQHNSPLGIITNCPDHPITYPAVMPPVEDYSLASAATAFDKRYWMMESLHFIQFLQWITF